MPRGGYRFKEGKVEVWGEGLGVGEGERKRWRANVRVRVLVWMRVWMLERGRVEVMCG